MCTWFECALCVLCMWYYVRLQHARTLTAARNVVIVGQLCCCSNPLHFGCFTVMRCGCVRFVFLLIHQLYSDSRSQGGGEGVGVFFPSDIQQRHKYCFERCDCIINGQRFKPAFALRKIARRGDDCASRGINGHQHRGGKAASSRNR